MKLDKREHTQIKDNEASDMVVVALDILDGKLGLIAQLADYLLDILLFDYLAIVTEVDLFLGQHLQPIAG